MGGSIITAFADQSLIEMQSTNEIARGMSDPKEKVIIAGKEVTVWEFSKDNLLIINEANNFPTGLRLFFERVAYVDESGNFTYELSGYPIGLVKKGAEYNIYGMADEHVKSSMVEGISVDDIIWGIRLSDYDPDGDGSYFDAANVSSTIIWIRFVEPTQPDSQVTKVWVQDDNGWRIQESDGSYITNEWYRDYSDGKWYYMGSDGYMLTNTTTPDGFRVGIDGAMVQ